MYKREERKRDRERLIKSEKASNKQTVGVDDEERTERE